MPDTTDDPQLTATYQAARAQLHAYITGIEDAHREQHPDPVGPDGTRRWDVDQAALRTAAWTPEENAEVQRLRAVELDAVLAVHRARDSGGE